MRSMLATGMPAMALAVVLAAGVESGFSAAVLRASR
jgi:hypothetical protein